MLRLPDPTLTKLPTMKEKILKSWEMLKMKTEQKSISSDVGSEDDERKKITLHLIVLY